MEDAHLVNAVAADYVSRYGHDAVDRLRDEELLAVDQGDAPSAQAWHDIAEAAALILLRLN
jgi:hypothetical protein